MDLQRAGLNALNISLDTFRQNVYGNITRRDGRLLKKVLAGIDLALQLGFNPVKVRIGQVNMIYNRRIIPNDSNLFHNSVKVGHCGDDIIIIIYVYQ